MMSAFEKTVTDTVAEKQASGASAAIDFGIIMQLMTMLMQFIQNCPFGQAKAAIKAGGTAARVAVFNSVKKSGYTGNAVELTEALVEKGKNASDADVDETVQMAYSMPLLSKLVVMLAITMCLASSALAGVGPFPVSDDLAGGPFPAAVTPLLIPDVPEVVVAPPVDDPSVTDQRPILQCLIPEGDWCAYCNWWKTRGDDGLPFRLDFVKTATEPMYGYPTFRVPRSADGRPWLISNTESSEAGAAQLVKSWRQITGNQESQYANDVTEDSTPYSEITRAFESIKLQPDQVVVDPGCDDGRALIVAVEQFGTKRAIGVEIDPARAAAARERVEQAGLSDRIEIITGDSTTMDLQGDVAFVYLYPPTLEALRPQLQKFDKVISYLHRLPGLATTERNGLHIYERATVSAAQQTTTQERPYAIYNGWKFYGPCCNSGRCGMRANIMGQIARREHVEQVVQQQATNYCRSCGR